MILQSRTDQDCNHMLRLDLVDLEYPKLKSATEKPRSIS
jgi:hypothetical protein